MTDRPPPRPLGELELLKIIAVRAAVVAVGLEESPVGPDDDWIDVRVVDLVELAEALDRLDEFKRSDHDHD